MMTQKNELTVYQSISQFWIFLRSASQGLLDGQDGYLGATGTSHIDSEGPYHLQNVYIENQKCEGFYFVQ